MVLYCQQLPKAEFKPFVERCAGEVYFASAIRRSDGQRFRNRVWPVFQRDRRRRHRRRPRDAMGTSYTQRVIRAIERSAHITAARRWKPQNPLLAHQMRVEEACFRKKAIAG